MSTTRHSGQDTTFRDLWQLSISYFKLKTSMSCFNYGNSMAKCNNSKRFKPCYAILFEHSML